MEKALVKIGNSKGVVIPKGYLKFFGEKVDLEMTPNGLLIKPVSDNVLTLSELLSASDLDAMFLQMQQEADNVEVQKFYGSEAVQLDDNSEDVADEY